MEAERMKSVEWAREFVEENKVFLLEEEVSPDVWGRIILHGVAPSRALHNDVIEASEELIASRNLLAGAISDESLSPRDLQNLGNDEKVCYEHYEFLRREFEVLAEFTDEIQRRYAASAGERESALLEEFCVNIPEKKEEGPGDQPTVQPTDKELAPEPDKEEVSRAYKPSLWRRLFPWS